MLRDFRLKLEGWQSGGERRRTALATVSPIVFLIRSESRPGREREALGRCVWRWKYGWRFRSVAHHYSRHDSDWQQLKVEHFWTSAAAGAKGGLIILYPAVSVWEWSDSTTVTQAEHNTEHPTYIQEDKGHNRAESSWCLFHLAH
jgi:hypothetical protein